MEGRETRGKQISSGVSGIDHYWGGVFRGGRYLVYGRNSAGKNLLPVVFVASATSRLESTLLVTRLRDLDLTIQASGVGFDDTAARQSGLLKVSRIPAELEVLHADDDGLESALKALASLIVDASADHVVIDDFSPFARFSSFDHFRTAFVRLLDEIGHIDSTLVLCMPAPANEASRRIIELMGSHMTGSIHVHMVQIDGHVQRTLSLMPQVGHATRRTEVPWLLETPAISTIQHPVAGWQPSAETGRENVDEPDEVDGTTPELRIDEMFSDTSESPAEKEPTYAGEHDLELTAHDETRGQAFEDRSRFTEELQLYFEDYESSGTPFVLVAMRMEDAYDRTDLDEFELISRIVEDSLDREDSIFVDPGTERMIIILGQENGGVAQDLFARIKNRMRAEMPQQSEQLMNAVSAVVVKNGSPFVTASEFLSYILDDD
ncbi:MAG: hypothetical protein KJO98_03990 [Rhodothermia bacterium]|nr:hypothetical protein [Rhodothermia bacterium]